MVKLMEKFRICIVVHETRIFSSCVCLSQIGKYDFDPKLKLGTKLEQSGRSFSIILSPNSAKKPQHLSIFKYLAAF